MPSLKTALFLASGAVLLPSLADASGIPERALVSAARQTARNAMAKVVVSDVSGTAAETATASDRRGLAEVQADEPWACLEYIGKEVCGSKETVATCEAETAYSCGVVYGGYFGTTFDECTPNTTEYKYANTTALELNTITEPSWQKYNDTKTTCDTYSSSRTSCNAQSDCLYNDGVHTCLPSNFFYGSLLDEYCPTQTQTLTTEQYLAKSDMCPYFAAAGKCALHQNSTACNADSDCYYLSLYGSSSLYGSRARDPEISNYRCRPADSVWSNVRDMLKMYHESEFRYEDGFCSKTYDSEESACDADDRCEWDGSDNTCGASDEVWNSRLRGHPHYVRAAAYRQTCETIETEALCGVADTADKCEWLEAYSGDEAGCYATPTYAAQQTSCECDAVKTAVPSVDYSNVVCATPNVEFVDFYSGARTFEGGALLGGALTLAACVLALA